MLKRVPFTRFPLDTAIDCPPGKVKTLQSDKDATMISTIMRQFSVSGVLPQSCQRVAMPPDVFLGGMDFAEHSNLLTQIVNNRNLTHENRSVDTQTPSPSPDPLPSSEKVDQSEKQTA